MFRKKVFLFLVITVCLYFISSGIFGNNGYLYNQSLKLQLQELDREAEKLGLDINSLIEEKNLLSTEEGLRDAAISLGYYVKGDSVHVFKDSALQKSSNNEEGIKEIFLYEPLSGPFCLAASSIVSCLITILTLVFTRKKDNDSGKNKPEDYSDDYFINA